MKAEFFTLIKKDWRSWLSNGLHICVIAGALTLILMITYDVLYNISYFANPRFLKVQFWLCLLFIADIIVDALLAPRKWHYMVTHIFFFLICLPYINIIYHYNIQVPQHWLFVMRILPMIRAAYVLARVSGSFGKDRIRGMFACYIILLAVVVYFSSLMFYVEEYQVNADVHSYWSALWWSLMNMTTAGCYINPVTVVGRVLSVILSGGGLILFPVFTVYIADAFSDDMRSESA